jgi:hypothetical protein
MSRDPHHTPWLKVGVVVLALAIMRPLIAAPGIVDARASFPQLTARPYVVADVRKAAAEIQLELTKSRHEEEALAGPLQFIVESLMSVGDVSAVPDDVLDAVVALGDSGRMARVTLLRCGDRAVARIVRVARETTGPRERRASAFSTLAQLARGMDPEGSLSPTSRGMIRDLARDSLNTTGLTAVEVAAIGVMAVTTGDPALRAEAVKLMEPAELTRRGIAPVWHDFVAREIRRTLDRRGGGLGQLQRHFVFAVCCRIQSASDGSETRPSASATNSATTSASVAVNSRPFTPRNVTMARRPMRLLPSRQGWFVTSPNAYAAASIGMSARSA